MEKRFSKKQVLSHLEVKITRLEEHYGFHDRTGWKQVEDKPIQTIVDYGRWLAYQEMEADVLRKQLEYDYE